MPFYSRMNEFKKKETIPKLSLVLSDTLTYVLVGSAHVSVIVVVIVIICILIVLSVSIRLPGCVCMYSKSNALDSRQHK